MKNDALITDITPRELHRLISGGWVLLGVDVRSGNKTYSCSNCWGQRYTLVTPGATLPSVCPKCGVANASIE